MFPYPTEAGSKHKPQSIEPSRRLLCLAMTLATASCNPKEEAPPGPSPDEAAIEAATLDLRLIADRTTKIEQKLKDSRTLDELNQELENLNNELNATRAECAQLEKEIASADLKLKALKR